MKAKLLILILLLSQTLVFGQSEFMLPFGSARQEVKEFVMGNRILKMRAETPDVVIATTGKVSIVYRFEDGELSEMVLSREVNSRKSAVVISSQYLWLFDAICTIPQEVREGEGFFSASAVSLHKDYQFDWREIGNDLYYVNVVVTPGTGVKVDLLASLQNNMNAYSLYK